MNKRILELMEQGNWMSGIGINKPKGRKEKKMRGNFKIFRRIGAERDWVDGGREGICSDCGLDFFDEEKAVWSLRPDMSPDLDRGVSGFSLAHSRCKICELKAWYNDR